jgi:hypothetical protein
MRLLAARGVMKKKRVPRNVFSHTGMNLASGIPKISALSFGMYSMERKM